jgi:dTDP-4-amino-4,6-dideoxygalactose transaminase
VLIRDTFLAFAPPLLREQEIAEAVETLRSGWLTTGPKVKRFEQEFAALVQALAALAVKSCTAALHLALVRLGSGPDDAVISTPMTFCSSIHVIEHVGARAILVDVEPDRRPARVRSSCGGMKGRDRLGRGGSRGLWRSAAPRAMCDLRIWTKVSIVF